MKKKILAAMLFVSFSLTSLSLAQPPARSGYNVAWFDDFSTTALDTTKWTAANTNVPTNNSQQDYLPSQVSVGGGNLNIKSENIPSRGLPYRSGLVTSTALQKHGRWDVRAQLPTSRGMWPAIWLLADAPWPSQGEIDIMENRGNEPLMTSSAFHYGTNPPFQHNFLAADQTARHNGTDVNYHTGFHDYSVEWDVDQIRFFVDDVHHWTVRDSDVGGFLTNNIGSMRLIINTAVGGDFLPNPDASTVWPQEMRVDHVHAYTIASEPRILGFDNGGFEERGGSLAQWSTFGNSVNNVSSGNENVRDGSESLKLYGQFNGNENFSGIEQGLSVKPGDQLNASAEALIASSDSIVGTGNEVQLKIDYYRKVFGQFGSADYISSEIVVLADGASMNDVWLSGQLNSIVPNGAVEARLAIVFRQQNNSAGAVFIDNVNFAIAVPEPATTSVFLISGLIFGLQRRRSK